MRFNGKIEEINHIVISDPSYGEDVTCRFERKGLNEKNWAIDIDIESVEDKFDDFVIRGIQFYVFLTKDRRLSELEEKGTIKYLNSVKIEETEIGMDTACVAIGINKNAKEIIDSRDYWQPECSLNTLTDGLFGTVKEGKFNNHTVFIWLSGYITEDAGYSKEEIIDYLKEQLNIKDLQKGIRRTIVIGKETTKDRMDRLASRFKEVTEDNPKLLKFFKEDKRFSNISFAGTYLAGMDLRNEQRKAGKLEGELEKSPYNKSQERMINEYIFLQKQYEKEMDEFENNIDMDI